MIDSIEMKNRIYISRNNIEEQDKKKYISRNSR